MCIFMCNDNEQKAKKKVEPSRSQKATYTQHISAYSLHVSKAHAFITYLNILYTYK